MRSHRPTSKLIAPKPRDGAPCPPVTPAAARVAEGFDTHVPGSIVASGLSPIPCPAPVPGNTHAADSLRARRGIRFGTSRPPHRR